MANYVYVCVSKVLIKFWVWVSQQYCNSATLHSYSQQYGFISIGCNVYERNVDIKLITFEWYICLLTHIYKFWKIFIIIINDSSDTNHSLKFTFLVVLAFTKKGKRRKQQVKQTDNLPMSIVLLSRESYSFCVMLVNVQINNIMRIFKYKCDKYF